MTHSCHILKSQHIRLSNQITILWNLCVQAPKAWCMRGVGFVAFLMLNLKCTSLSTENTLVS